MWILVFSQLGPQASISVSWDHAGMQGPAPHLLVSVFSRFPQGMLENGLFKTWAVDTSPSKSPSLGGEQKGQKLRSSPRIHGRRFNLSEEDVGSPHLCFLLLWKEQSPLVRTDLRP